VVVTAEEDGEGESDVAQNAAQVVGRVDGN
jgi:hypothetical protein